MKYDITRSWFYWGSKYKLTAKKRNNPSKKIICKETKEKFASILECSKKMKISTSLLSKHLSHPELKEKAKGFTFKYL